MRGVVMLAAQPLDQRFGLLRRRRRSGDAEEARRFLPHFAASLARRNAPRVLFGADAVAPARLHPESVFS